MKFAIVFVLLATIVTVSYTAHAKATIDSNSKDLEAKGELKRERRFVAELITAIAATAISAGAGMAAAGIQADLARGYGVAVELTINNYSKWPLTSPVSYPNGGQIPSPAVNVMPGKKEMMVMHKAPGTATGSYGTASWKVNSAGCNGCSIVVMWSAPYSFDFHSNYLAVGIGKLGSENSKGIFDKMYEGSSPYTYKDDRIEFVTRDYYYDTAEISYCSSDFCILGTMGTSHKPQVTISFVPKQKEDLASDVKDFLAKSHGWVG